MRNKAQSIHHARRKSRLKQYADERRAAKTTDIEEGDKVLLGQRRETKLSTHFEPNPYRVIEKDGNAIVIQYAQGQTKMRNVGHMKKFVAADPVTSVTPSPVKLSIDGSHVSRQKSAPKWLHDFVV